MEPYKREDISFKVGWILGLLAMVAGFIMPWWVFQWRWFWNIVFGGFIGILAALVFGICGGKIIHYILKYIFTNPAARKHEAEREKKRLKTKEEERRAQIRTKAIEKELRCPKCNRFVSSTTPIHGVMMCPCGCLVRIENYKVAC